MDKEERLAQIDAEIKRLVNERKELNGERLMINERIFAIRKKWNLAGPVGTSISYIARSAVTQNGKKVIEYKKMTKKQQETVKELVDTIVDAYEFAFNKMAWED